MLVFLKRNYVAINQDGGQITRVFALYVAKDGCKCCHAGSAASAYIW